MLRVGDIGVCIAKLSWTIEPYFGEPVEIVGYSDHFGDYVLKFLNADSYERLGEHLFQTSQVVTEAEWALIANTRGV